MDVDAPSPAGGEAPHGVLDRLMGVSAALGGLLAVGVATLVTVSVLGRWLFYLPVRGDFELVRIATACAVFAYLPYTQARRANIMVDTFTQRLPQRVRDAMDAFWDLVFAACMAACAYGLYLGTFDARENYETTSELQLQMWPFILLCALLCALLALTAVATALLKVRGGR
jgi:TRAP-type C4-dicarboxylate transport system permease small subunit